MDAPPAHGPLQILLVEDHSDIGRMLLAMLEALGYDAKLAASVAAATDAAADRKFDLLISDYSLPDGTGLDVLQKLKAMGLGKAILVTAFGKQFQKVALKAGFTRYLEKPVDFEQLRAAIEEIAAGTPS